MIVLILLILGESAILFLVSSNEMDTVLQNEWPKLDENIRIELAAEFECDVNDASACIAAARTEAEAARRMIYYICGGTMAYQLIMLACAAFYMKGLKKKLTRKKSINEGKDEMDKQIPPDDPLMELGSGEYKNIKHV